MNTFGLFPNIFLLNFSFFLSKISIDGSETRLHLILSLRLNSSCTFFASETSEPVEIIVNLNFEYFFKKYAPSNNLFFLKSFLLRGKLCIAKISAVG